MPQAGPRPGRSRCPRAGGRSQAVVCRRRSLARRRVGPRRGCARPAGPDRLRLDGGSAAPRAAQSRRGGGQPDRGGQLDSSKCGDRRSTIADRRSDLMLIARSVHPLPGDAERKERLLSLVDGFGSRRVLVVGDLIADEFIYGHVERISREAPVLILKYDATEIVAGGAGNAANNVAALGGRARLVGAIGTDAEGRRLLSSLHRGVDRTRVLRARAYRTPVKTRILAGGVHSAKQQVVRIDRDAGWPLTDAGSRAYTRKIKSALDGCDAVLMSDYGSGLVTPALAERVRRTLEQRARRRPVPVLVDSRYRLLD